MIVAQLISNEPGNFGYHRNVAFRDDRDALLARNDALEQELEDTKRALADAQRELAEATSPEPEPAETDSSEPARHRPSPAGPRPSERKALGRRLADELIAGDGAVVKQAKAELRGAHTKVSDAAAKQLARYVRGRGPKAEAVCRVLAHNDAPRFGGRGWAKLFRALLRASSKPGLESLAQGALANNLMHGPAKSWLKRKQAEREAEASTNLLWRALSVFKRAWVIVVFGMPALFYVILLLTQPSIWLYPTIGMVVLALFCIAVDAYLRRCPRCRKALAGKLLSIVGDNYGGHTLSWSCVFCKRRWKT